jgi:hypothetical protein
MRKYDIYGFSSLCEPFALFYFKDKEYCIRAILEADCLFIFGLPAIKTFLPKIICRSRFWRKYDILYPEIYIRTKRIIYFAACSNLLEKNIETNNIYKQWPIDIFFHAIDLKNYVKAPARKILPYVPPMSLKYFPSLNINRDKNESIVLGHSPGTKFNNSRDIKGTFFIKKCFKNLSKKYSNVSYKIIHGVTNSECMKIKSFCSIFVDQVIDKSLYNIKPPYLGGQGKSGIESMLLGCLTMTSYRDLNSEPYFPTTPIIQIDKGNLAQTIEKFILDADLRCEIAKKQKEWAEKYLSDEFFASYICKYL